VTSELHTTHMQNLLQLFQRGDRVAVDELFRRTAARMERIASAMLSRSPAVRRHVETADIVNEAAISLLRSWQKLSFDSMRQFYGLTAAHIRRRLIDMVRLLDRPERNPVPLGQAFGDSALAPGPVDDDLHLWQALHEAVEALPADLQEVFSLRFYHGWTNGEVAELLDVSTKSVIRRWLAAQVRLSERLGSRSLSGEHGAISA
jgi:RNA polymerase sigma factor (sigma-70 family)